MDLKKLIDLGKKAQDVVEEMQGESKPDPPSARSSAAAKRKPGTIEARDAIVLYWKDADGQDTGWYCEQSDAGGALVMAAGRVGDYGDIAKDQPKVAQELFRDHFGFALEWEQPDPGELRFIGRKPSG